MYISFSSIIRISGTEKNFINYALDCCFLKNNPIMVATHVDNNATQIIEWISAKLTAIPPRPDPVANPICTKELFRLNIIDAACGVREIRL